MSAATVWEAMVLVDAGISDVFLVNQVVDPIRMALIAELARQATIREAALAFQEAGTFPHSLNLPSAIAPRLFLWPGASYRTRYGVSTECGCLMRALANGLTPSK